MRCLMTAVEELARTIGTAPACDALAVSRASIYRRPRRETPHVRPTPRRALTSDERGVVLSTLHSDRFVDRAPAQIWAALLDNKIYCCFTRAAASQKGI